MVTLFPPSQAGSTTTINAHGAESREIVFEMIATDQQHPLGKDALVAKFARSQFDHKIGNVGVAFENHLCIVRFTRHVSVTT